MHPPRPHCESSSSVTVIRTDAAGEAPESVKTPKITVNATAPQP